MAEMFYDDDADLSVIQGRNVAVLGYGSQGHAHALSLRDSGVDVRVGLPEGSKSRAQGRGRGPAGGHAGRGVRGGRPRSWCWRPDPVQRKLYAEAIEPNLVDGDALFFGHGLNIRYGSSSRRPASTSAWSRRRARATWSAAQFVDGRGVPVLVAVEQDATGKALGPRAVLRQGHRRHPRRRASRRPSPRRPRPTCSASRPCCAAALSELVKAGFETLIEAGYQPEVAYFECLHELKLIVDLMYEGGIAKMRWSVSDTAEYGDYIPGPRIIDDARQGRDEAGPRRDQGRHVRRSGSSTTRTPARPEFNALRAKGEEHPIEETGRELRQLMAWVKADDTTTPRAPPPADVLGRRSGAAGWRRRGRRGGRRHGRLGQRDAVRRHPASPSCRRTPCRRCGPWRRWRRGPAPADLPSGFLEVRARSGNDLDPGDRLHLCGAAVPPAAGRIAGHRRASSGLTGGGCAPRSRSTPTVTRRPGAHRAARSAELLAAGAAGLGGAALGPRAARRARPTADATAAGEVGCGAGSGGRARVRRGRTRAHHRAGPVVAARLSRPRPRRPSGPRSPPTRWLSSALRARRPAR